MNVRKPTDYSALFAALDELVAANLPQMELYCGIGRLVSGRPEKGAAVAAAEYLHSAYPDTAGFSPRNLRRMRDFYRTYESDPKVNRLDAKHRHFGIGTDASGENLVHPCCPAAWVVQAEAGRADRIRRPFGYPPRLGVRSVLYSGKQCFGVCEQ